VPSDIFHPNQILPGNTLELQDFKRKTSVAGVKSSVVENEGSALAASELASEEIAST